MVAEDLVSGEGWISDDSSFYGDEDEQDHHHARVDTFMPKLSLSSTKPDLNAILAAYRVQLDSASTGAKPEKHSSASPETSAVSSILSNSKPPNFLLDRRVMEEARLARHGKRKREPSPEPVLFNPGQGSPDAWQLGESPDDFVRRLPPLTTSVSTCSWIWVHNPHFDRRDKEKYMSHRADEFRNRGSELLGQSIQTRQQIRNESLQEPKAKVTRLLGQESKALQQRITDLAVECEILSGKWMLFPKLEDVTRIWKHVVQGVIENRLGPTAKVAPDEGKPGERLICIYTKDFRDEDDVLRVLQELETMGLVSSGRSIYYKSDAFTYLDLYKQTASEYGLQASLYTSYKMMSSARLSRATALSGKKQKTLNNHL